MAEPSAERSALLQHPDLRDTNPETRKYRTFLRRGLDRDAPTFMVIASNTGATQVIGRILEGLPQSVNLSVIAHTRDAQTFKDPKFGLTETSDSAVTPAERIASTRADLGLAGFSTEPHAEMAMTVGAEYPTVWMQDYPQGILGFYRTHLGHPANYTPDHIFAVSEFGAQQEREALLRAPGVYDPRSVEIRVMGNPYDDRYARSDKEEIRLAVRDHFDLPQDRRFLLYMGVPGTSSPEVLRWLAEASAETGKQNDQVMYGRHPREDGKTPEERAKRIQAYNGAAMSLRRFNGLIDVSGFKPEELGLNIGKSDALTIGADGLITTISSTGSAAVRWGVLSGHVLNRDILEGTEVPDFEAPTEVTSGASVEIYTPEDMIRFLRNFGDETVMRSLKAGMDKFKPVPGATEAVSKALLEIANNQRRGRIQTL